MTGKINIVCARCGSENVTRDALARWDVESQRWEISCELDNSNCDDCENEDILQEVELPDLYAEAAKAILGTPTGRLATSEPEMQQIKPWDGRSSTLNNEQARGVGKSSALGLGYGQEP